MKKYTGVLRLKVTTIVDVQRLFINRNFALLWIGQAISQLGDYVFATTLILWIATDLGRGQSWAPLAISGVIVMSTLPSVLVRPVAGVFVDRWDKRGTMLVMDGLRASLIALLFLIVEFIHQVFPVASGLAAFWLLGAAYLTVLLASVCAQFFFPARFVLINDIIDRFDRTRAFGRSEATRSLALICGPAIAALLFFAVGVKWALIIDALSFMASFLTLLAIQVAISAPESTKEQPGRFAQEILSGVRFVALNRVLLTMTVAVCIVALGSGSQDALVIFFLTQNLQAPASLYGLLSSIFAAGAMVGAIAANSLAKRLGTVRVFCGTLLTYGILSVIFARLTSFIPSLVLFFLLGVSYTVGTVISLPLIMQVTPRNLAGRVTSVNNSLVQLAWAISILLSGYLTSTLFRAFHTVLFGMALGPIDTILMAAGVITTGGGLYALIRLRGMVDENLDQEKRHKPDVSESKEDRVTVGGGKA